MRWRRVSVARRTDRTCGESRQGVQRWPRRVTSGRAQGGQAKTPKRASAPTTWAQCGLPIVESGRDAGGAAHTSMRFRLLLPRTESE
eukprot:1306332-Pyramimonas_sp.AAC.1